MSVTTEQLPNIPIPPAGSEIPGFVADGGVELGDGIRNPPEKLKDWLLDLRREWEATSDQNRSRREQLRKCLKIHEFFRGNQYSWWDFTIGQWRTGIGSSGGQQSKVPQGPSQALYVLNFLQGYVLSIIALLVGNRPTQRFFPEDPNEPLDVVAAQKADLVMKIFEKNERMHDQYVKTVYALCIGGTAGSYIRTVVDGERFGWLEKPVNDSTFGPTGPPRYKCPVCDDDLHVADEQGNPPSNCDTCNAPLPTQPDVPASRGLSFAPRIGADGKPVTRKIPRGRTIRTVVDIFELKLPPEAAEQPEFPFVIRSREVDKALPRSVYPEIADKIGSSGRSNYETSSEDERRVRRQATFGTTAENRSIVTDSRDRVTFTECWFRPRAYYQLDDPIARETLKAMFPDGVYVAFANDTFCEARSEKMDEHWRFVHALPGRGQIREPIMASVIPAQEIANDITNIIRDIIEYTLPVTFVSSRLLDVRKWGRSQVMAGATYGVTDLGRPLSESFFQTEPGKLPEYATQFLEQLRTEISQFLTGAFPAAYGGGTAGNNTAQGIETERQAALGRINLFLQAIREHYADFAPLVVEDFKKNAIEPLTFVDENEGGEQTLSTVSPDDLEAGQYRARPEMVEEYPTTWTQRQALMLQLFGLPTFQAWSGLLQNLTKVKTTMGTDLKAPGEDAYRREFKIISQLLQEEPQPGPDVPAPPVPGIDPATGQPGMVPAIDPQTQQPAMVPGPPVSSRPPLPPPPPGAPPLEDNVTMLKACADFYYSERGAKAMETGGPGWENFMIHVQERQTVLAPPPRPPGLPPGPGAPGQGAPPPSAEPPSDQAGAPPN